MKYEREQLNLELAGLIGKTIQRVYYCIDFEGYKSFNQLADKIIEIPIKGMLLETNLDDRYNLSSFDYAPYYGLEGIILEKDQKRPFGRPNQIEEVFWKNLKGQVITRIEIIEHSYINNETNHMIPFGLKFVFENEHVLFVLNMGIESYNDSDNTYELSRGGELVLFSDTKTILNYDILCNHTFDLHRI